MTDSPERIAGRPLPVLQALLLADAVYTDVSGKRIICGTFGKIFCNKFPAHTTFMPFVFVLLVDVMNEIALQFRWVRLEDNQILMESSSVTIRNNDPLMPVDIAVQIPNLPLPLSSTYGFECWADDAMIGSVRLPVVQTPRPE